MKIGVFDSGAGGLTVAGSLIESGMFSSIVYYGDTARVPYGNKDSRTIIRYSLEALDFFAAHEIELLIVACNTVSVTALDTLRRVAAYPVFGMVGAGVWWLNQQATAKSDRILIIGTNVTVSSGAYQSAAYDSGFVNVDSIPTGLLVSLVEEGILDGPVVDAVLQHYFGHISAPDIILLACTHFPLLAEAISRAFPSAILIHSGEAIVKWLLHTGFSPPSSDMETELEIYASDNPQQLRSVAEAWIAHPHSLHDRKL